MIKVGIFDGGNGRMRRLFVGVLLLACVCFSAVYGASASGGFKIFALKNITVKQGKAYLNQAGIGTVSELVGSPALLVTGPADEVARAQAILGIVDAPGEFVVRVVAGITEASGLPSFETIGEKVSGVSVGTFAAPPEGDGAKAIMGIVNNSFVVVAPADRLDRIVAAIGELLKEQAEAVGTVQEAPAEPDKGAAAPSEPKKDKRRVGKIDTGGRVDANEPRTVVTPTRRETPERKMPATTTSLYKPPPLKNADHVLAITLPEKLDVITLMQLVGQYLDLNFMYDPLIIKGDVMLMLTGDLQGKVRVKDLYPLLESVMHFKGFGMTRNDEANMVTVVPIAQIPDRDPVLIETEADRVTTYGNVIVTRIFKLEHIDTASAQNLLSGMKLGLGGISPIEGAKTLFVTGFAYRMPRVERLLKMIDKPGKTKKFRFKQLKFTMATALAPKVKTLAEQLGTVSISIGQMASASSFAASYSGRRPGETTAAYTARVAKERAARTARMTPSARPSTGGAAAAPGVYLDADERTNRIMLIGLDEEIDAVEELIDALDVAQTDLRKFQLYRIEHVDAEQARKKLQELEIIGGSTGGGFGSASSRITSPSRTGVTTKSAVPPRASTSSSSRTSTSGGLTGLVEDPLVVVIEATNSLLVNATDEQHTEITRILKFVDAETAADVHPYVIYPLENQTPEDLAGILEKLIQETVKDKDGKIEQVIKKTDEEIVIVPDEKTFSIIVYASKKNQDWISNLIETLDKRRPQVLIDVTLVEVTKTEKFEYDLNLISSLPNLVDTSGLTGVITEGKSVGDIISQLSSSDHLARYMDFQSNAGAATGFYGDTHINILIKAMQAQDYGRVLAKPKILVNDNETGTISTTDTTYITKTSSIPVSTGQAGQQATLIQTAVDYDPYDAGIQLEITPHISEGDLLRLEITLTRSDFGNVTGEKPPDTTSSDIQTIVTVPDGSTIILGGMIKLNQGKGGTKVPFFGDLPLIGGLFRSVSNSDLQRRLYIFVKAQIIRPAEMLAKGLPDLERISEQNRQAFEKFEQEFQSYKSFPGLRAKPLQPVRVLDDDTE